MARRALLVGLKHDLSVTKLSGDYRGPNRSDLCLRRTKPFTRLPVELFDPVKTHWEPVAWGRWRFADMIALGELRSVEILARILGAHRSAHRRKFMVLEDNMVVSFCCAKGRSASPLINYSLRRKAATLLGSEIQNAAAMGRNNIATC